MRLIHISDLHLGYRQYQRQTPTGINQREADVAAAFKRAIDKMIEVAPDLVLFAGEHKSGCSGEPAHLGMSATPHSQRGVRATRRR